MATTKLRIAQGGTGQGTNTLAFNALAPASPANGDILYNDGTNWITRSGQVNDNFLKISNALGSNVKAETIARDRCVAANALTSGVLYTKPIYLSVSATLTGIKYLQLTAGVYTANNENRIGLYTYSAGTLTLAASCANTGTLWKASQGIVTTPFSGTYAAAAGLFYIGILYSSSAQTTQPTIGVGSSLAIPTLMNSDFANSAKMSAFKSTQTTLPASVALSTFTELEVNWWLAAY